MRHSNWKSFNHIGHLKIQNFPNQPNCAKYSTGIDNSIGNEKS